MKSEQEVQNEIRVALTQAGYTVFRTNVGKVKPQMADGLILDCRKVTLICMVLDQTDRYFMSK